MAIAEAQHLTLDVIKQNSNPITVAIASGAVVNATMPSIEYKNSFQKDHFVVPADLCSFSYSSHFVLKPTQPKIPFVKRLYSLIDKTALTTFLVINR